MLNWGTGALCLHKPRDALLHCESSQKQLHNCCPRPRFQVWRWTWNRGLMVAVDHRAFVEYWNSLHFLEAQEFLGVCQPGVATKWENCAHGNRAFGTTFAGGSSMSFWDFCTCLLCGCWIPLFPSMPLLSSSCIVNTSQHMLSFLFACGACFCRPMVRNFRRPFRNWDIVDGILLCGKSAGFFSIRVFVYNSRLGAGWPDELRFDKRMSLPRGFTWERAAKEVKSSCASHTVRCREPTVKLWVYATLAFGAGQMPLDQQSGHIRSHWLVLILSMLVQFRFGAKMFWSYHHACVPCITLWFHP